jgi:hydrogenase maturation protease
MGTTFPAAAFLEAQQPAAPVVDTLVLSLGNPLRGDDGVGAAVIEMLAHDPRLPEHVTVVDGGTPGLESVLLLQGYRRAVIIDAADMGRAPGEWVRFTRDDVLLEPADPDLRSTLHSAGLAEALALGDALGILPEEIIIIGVQPLAIDWLPGLSEPVRAAVPAVYDEILIHL